MHIPPRTQHHHHPTHLLFFYVLSCWEAEKKFFFLQYFLVIRFPCLFTFVSTDKTKKVVVMNISLSFPLLLHYSKKSGKSFALSTTFLILPLSEFLGVNGGKTTTRWMWATPLCSLCLTTGALHWQHVCLSQLCITWGATLLPPRYIFVFNIFKVKTSISHSYEGKWGSHAFQSVSFTPTWNNEKILRTNNIT